MTLCFLCLELTLLIAVHWASGEVTLNDETQLPIFTPSMSGFMDWGISAYAAAGQTLPSSSSASTKSGFLHDRWISYGKQWFTPQRSINLFLAALIADFQQCSLAYRKPLRKKRIRRFSGFDLDRRTVSASGAHCWLHYKRRGQRTFS